MDVLYPTRLPITHTGTSSRSYGWLFLFLSPPFNLIFLPIGQLSCNASCTSITRVASNRNLYPPFFTVSPIFGHWLPAGCNKKEVDRQKFSNPISITFCDDSAPFSCVCICLIYLKKKVAKSSISLLNVGERRGSRHFAADSTRCGKKRKLSYSRGSIYTLRVCRLDQLFPPVESLLSFWKNTRPSLSLVREGGRSVV